MFKKEKVINYYNPFTKRKEFQKLEWNFDDGFESLSLLMGAIMHIGFRKDSFLYVYFNNMYYGISLDDDKRIILTKNFIIYHEKNKDQKDNCSKLKILQINTKEDIYYSNNNIRASYIDNWTLLNDFLKFDNKLDCGFISVNDKIKKMIGSPSKKDKDSLSYLRNSCFYIFAYTFFDTFIFIYDINSVDSYFKGKNHLSLDELRNKGIKQVNPFSMNCKYTKNNEPYTFPDYIDDRRELSKSPTEKRNDKIMTLYKSIFIQDEPMSLKKMRKKQNKK